MQVSQIAQIASNHPNYSNKTIDFNDLAWYLFDIPGVHADYERQVYNATEYAKTIEDKGFQDVSLEILIRFNDTFVLWVSVQWDEGRKVQFFAMNNEYNYSRATILADFTKCDNKERTQAQLLKFREYETMKTIYQDEVRKQVEDAKKQRKIEEQEDHIAALENELIKYRDDNEELREINRELEKQLNNKR